MHVDLNADVGESFGPYTLGNDAGLMRSISSASLAAGFHGGDPSVLRHTIRLAKRHGVSVGAHPGFPDLVGFGRRELYLSAQAAEDLVLYQIAAVSGVAAAEGVRLRHVKPHGALYNMAARDPELATAIARATTAFDRDLILIGPPESELLKAAEAEGLHGAAEVFADRAYTRSGTLVPRSAPGATLVDPDTVVRRAIGMIRERSVETVDGSRVQFSKIDTICVHGDTEGADVLAAALREGLRVAGIDIRALGAE